MNRTVQDWRDLFAGKSDAEIAHYICTARAGHAVSIFNEDVRLLTAAIRSRSNPKAST